MNILASLWSKETEIEGMMADHIDLVEETIEKFRQGMFVWLDEEDLKRANELGYETHKLEGRADDLRREIEMKLIEGALLARSRSEMLDLIERIDKLANAAEAAMDFTMLQQIKIPEGLKPLAKEVVEKDVEIMGQVRQGALALFAGNGEALKYTEAIEDLEGEVDEIERDFIQDLFAMDMELARKILLRQYLEALVEISDRAEDLSDEMEILVATRKT